MTEVAQVAAVVDHDMDDVTSEDEHNMSDAENKEEDITYEEDDVHENNASEEKNEKTRKRMEEGKPCCVNDEASNKTEKTHRNGVKQKENDNESDERSEAVNGVAQDAETKEDAQPNTNEDQNISDVSLKKEASEEFKIISDKISWILSFTGTIYPCCSSKFMLSSL